ncbi:Protein CBG14439 [Caenorhabditis briggsae]|uniref:Protein CBG14439 n=1 Tax=Caenorhabditis briggsae TaxID=6238 RepID=A8XJZ1_CAEBR|nr:Protein CBG14439 [Caenorhabditis briggsae]CAP32967.1 Protein CBG14439 [Caenorhabditis briggsae]
MNGILKISFIIDFSRRKGSVFFQYSSKIITRNAEVCRGCGKSCQRDPATSTSFINRLNPICVERQQNVHERQETLLSSEQKSTGQRESEKEKDCWTIKMY